MTSQRLRRLPGRQLVAVPTPAATPATWLLVGLSPELSPVELLTGARAMLIPLDALLHPEGHQPDATRLHQLLTHQPTGYPAGHPTGRPGQPEVRFLVDATGMIEALVFHTTPEAAEQFGDGDGDELPLPVWEDPELAPEVQARVRALLAVEIAAYLAD